MKLKPQQFICCTTKETKHLHVPDIEIIFLVFGVISKEVDEKVIVVESCLIIIDDVVHLGISGVGKPDASRGLHCSRNIGELMVHV